MLFILKIRSILRNLIFRGRVDAGLEYEVQAHFEMVKEEHIRKGMPLDEAERAARIELGGLKQLKEQVREQRLGDWLQSVISDFRYGVRSLFKDRRVAAVAVFALALGIGASTVVFSVLYNGLLNPFLYRDASNISIFQIHDLERGGNRGRGAFSFPEFLDYRDQNHVFSDIVGTAYTPVLYSSMAGVQRFEGAYVTTNTFPFLGVPPLLGRWLTDDDANAGAVPVFVMSYSFWKEQFGGDPKLLGATLTLNGQRTSLVGIMPPRFDISEPRFISLLA